MEVLRFCFFFNCLNGFLVCMGEGIKEDICLEATLSLKFSYFLIFSLLSFAFLFLNLEMSGIKIKMINEGKQDDMHTHNMVHTY